MTTIDNYYTYLPVQGSCFFCSKEEESENKLEKKKEMGKEKGEILAAGTS
jgi:hypothetical protein